MGGGTIRQVKARRFIVLLGGVALASLASACDVRVFWLDDRSPDREIPAGPPPPLVLEVPEPTAVVVTTQATLALRGRCHPSTERALLRVGSVATEVALDAACAARGSFAGELDLDPGDTEIVLVAANEHGETAGERIVIRRIADELEVPRRRSVSAPPGFDSVTFTVDARERIYLYDGETRTALVGVTDYLAFVEPPDATYSDLEGARLLTLGDGRVAALTSRREPDATQVGDPIHNRVVFSLWDDGWRELAVLFDLDSMNAVLVAERTQDGVVAGVLEKDFTGAPNLLHATSWDGAAWTTLETLSLSPALDDGAFVTIGTETYFVGFRRASGSLATGEVWRLAGTSWAPVSDGVAPAFGSPLVETRPLIQVAFATHASELYAVAQDDVGIEVLMWSADAASWVSRGRVASGATSDLTSAGLVFGGPREQLYVGWVRSGVFELVRGEPNGDAWTPVVDTNSLARPSPPFGATLVPTPDGRVYALYQQANLGVTAVTTQLLDLGQGSLFLDEWTGTQWVQHEPLLARPEGRPPEAISAPLAVLSPDNALHVVSTTGTGEAVYRWTGTDWVLVVETADASAAVRGLFVEADRLTVATVKDASVNDGLGYTLAVWEATGADLTPLGQDLNVDPTEYIAYPTMTRDEAGRLVLVWTENGVRDLYVKRWDGAAWTQLGGDLSSYRMAAPTPLVVGGELYVLRQDDFSFLYTPTLLHWSEAGGAWAPVGASPLHVGTITGHARNNAWPWLEEGAIRVAVHETVGTDATGLSVYDFDGSTWQRQSIVIEPAAVTSAIDGDFYERGELALWLTFDPEASAWTVRRAQVPAP